MLVEQMTYSLSHMSENDIAKHVFDCALEIHKDLGPGLLENAYLECLVYKLRKKGFAVDKQRSLPLVYEDVKLEAGYRLDIHIENKLIVEVKAIEALHDIHMAQLLTYLKLTGNKLGLLINFNSVLLKNGFRRVINGYL
jgi:GxxExxY protein